MAHYTQTQTVLYNHGTVQAAVFCPPTMLVHATI